MRTMQFVPMRTPTEILVSFGMKKAPVDAGA